MRKCTPREIVKEVSDVQTIILPNQWFDNLSDKQSVFVSLYDWMIKNNRVPSENKENLHNRTYVGEKLYRKLLYAEKNRLKKEHKIKGDELDRAVTWSDINSGPKTEIGGCNIIGDIILVIPESSRQALGELSAKIYRKECEAAINKIRANAAGATFYQWLLSQINRPDRVGDIARDAVDDKGFPRESNQYEEIEKHLRSQGACSAAIESLKEGWLEYLKQYPKRVHPSAWCSECGERLDIENALLAWSSESKDLFVLDSGCFSKYKLFDVMVSRPLSGVTQDDLKELVEKSEASEFDIKELIERLKLWGIMQVTIKGSFTCQTVSSKYARRSISNSKRYDVLRRDKFQCVLCGASGNEARLEVDHIIPFSRGGTDDIGNLQCLCFQCNRGKHAKAESIDDTLERS